MAHLSTAVARDLRGHILKDHLNFPGRQKRVDWFLTFEIKVEKPVFKASQKILAPNGRHRLND